MKTILTTLLALATLCATGYGQTIKSLGYNTANGQVVYTGTNILAFTNQVQIGFSGSGGIIIEPEGTLFFFDGDGSRDVFVFDNGVGGADEARARTNLGLGATWLTNTDAETFRRAIGLGAFDAVYFEEVFVDQQVVVGSGTNTLSIVAASGGKIVYSATNTAPADTTNPVTWIELNVGTNSYRVPLYQ